MILRTPVATRTDTRSPYTTLVRSVEADELVGGLGADLDPGDVPHAHHRAVRSCADDDVLELLLARQASLGGDRELELLVRVQRRCADAPDRSEEHTF